MGSCSPKPIETDSIPHREVHPQHPVLTQAETSAMADRSDFNNFMELVNQVASAAREKYSRYDQLWGHYCELQIRNEEIMAENQSLRQRISNDSEMSHRSHQSISEDATSRNKRSDVLQKCKRMDGATRKQAIEAFGKSQSHSRTELWYKKDLTCRIFLAAFSHAEHIKRKFSQQVLPRFFQSAASVSLYFGRDPSQVNRLSEQEISEEMGNLLTTKSFNVACSSALKELAVTCDLTGLEEKFMEDLMTRRKEWKERYPWLPYLDDSTIKSERMRNYIKDCLRLAWRMVNLLPPLKIVTLDEVQGRKCDEYFEMEIEENREKAKIMHVCVWPAVIDGDNDEVLVKGAVAVIPRPKNLPMQV